ncbi:MAG: 16S rRNA (cytidine(1402)-2'-O)-methyltransferase [Opitutaceae bacterium]|nr:16S rRNA (cytidine(1402)-2'-O)-methyltransferase [Opitutaceae bacterium]
MTDPAPPPLNPSLTAQPGTLYIVATPIGNLADITERARCILASVDVVACEDTRTSGNLLTRLGVRKDLVAYHDHNETHAAGGLAMLLQNGKSVAIITDAGTPGISDPGFRVTRECRRKSLPVVPVPGACALAAVVSAAGLPSNGFLFAGFLPPKSAARAAFLKKYQDFEYTLALYESCHRIGKFCEEIAEVLGPARVVCVAKEVTKLHEAFYVGPAAEVRDKVLKSAQKGEYVVLIAASGFEL